MRLELLIALRVEGLSPLIPHIQCMCIEMFVLSVQSMCVVVFAFKIGLDLIRVNVLMRCMYVYAGMYPALLCTETDYRAELSCTLPPRIMCCCL